MSILKKILAKPEIAVDKVLGEFTKDEIEIPYPVLSQQLISALVEDLALVGHLKTENGKATVTEKGAAKVDEFRRSLSAEEKEALKF
jgi:ribosomal protein S19E (S16A)